MYKYCLLPNELARNEQTGKTNYRQVLRTTVKHAAVTVSVTLADTSGQKVETITSSREHPFYVDGKGFVPASGLAIGRPYRYMFVK